LFYRFLILQYEIDLFNSSYFCIYRLVY